MLKFFHVFHGAIYICDYILHLSKSYYCATNLTYIFIFGLEIILKLKRKIT